MAGKKRNGYCCCWIWSLIILIFVLLNFGILIADLVTVKSIRSDELPHCFRIFGTGPDEIPGPGEPPPFSPEFGGQVKGKLEVGGFCLKWDLLYFNLTSEPTAMHLHGMLFQNETVAAVCIDMGVEGASGTTGELIRKKCLEITYEQEFAIASRPEAFYLNMHNSNFPDGAVRSPLGTRCGGSI